MHHLMESMALLTKSIGIITPLILSIIVCVALRLISYMEEPTARIIPRELARLYRTTKDHKIVLYKGFGVRNRGKEKGSSPTYLHSEMKSNRIVTMHQCPCDLPSVCYDKDLQTDF